MKHPVLDPRDLEAIRRQVKALARSYTPEWRYEETEDDPGAALAELFCTMFYQTVDRMNALPGKLYTEFLNQIGFQEPAPVAARGDLRFLPHDTVETPVPVRAGTQAFTSDEAGDNVVYETLRPLEATAARLLELYYADSGEDWLQRLDLERPQAFFTGGGENLQRHRFSLAENRVLRLSGPAVVTVELRQPVPYLEEETARRLAETMRWTYRSGGEAVPFDRVEADGGRIRLTKADARPLEADEAGRLAIACEGRPQEALVLDQASLLSEPLAPCPAQSLYAGDVPLEPGEGGYCFGQRPAPYSLFYLRCDEVLTKAGARAMAELDIAPIVFNPPAQGPAYQFNQAIIDKRGAVEQKPDDVFISAVVWEYFNGLGWRQLAVEGDRNPFSCRQTGPLRLTFRVPEDLAETEVNAEPGCYLRARVVAVENQFSPYQRWIVPLLRGVQLQWRYDAPVRAAWMAGENNGRRREVDGAAGIDHLALPVLEVLESGPRAMYLRFDRSPHAMPLSLHFQVAGRRDLGEQLLWERWNGKAFEAVRAVDETEQLLHSGCVYLYLPEPLPRGEFFGQEGCWLRLSRTTERGGPGPVVAAVTTNVVPAVQRQREPEQIFDTGVYEAGKELQLLSGPVQDCAVWVDEMQGLSSAEAEALARERPDAVRLEREDHVLRRCWVRWEPVADLALAGPGDRVYTLDPYQGRIRFGDGRRGRVPPAGDRNIRVAYASGGGQRGNVPAGAVRALMGGLPRISQVYNITAMAGGTGRLTQEEMEARGSRRLRTRGRAAGSRDYEDLVREAFPQVCHIRCFSGRDPQGRPAPGHVTVVLTGRGRAGQGDEALCRQVYQYLSGRCSCCLTAEGRLHVHPATVLTINTQVTIEVEEPDLASETQQAVARRLEALLRDTWQARPIGDQIRLDEVYAAVRETPNVRRIRRLLVEGAYDDQGQAHLAPLERDSDFPYGVTESGLHTVRLI